MSDETLEDDGKPVDYEIVATQVGGEVRMVLLARCPFCRRLVNTSANKAGDDAASPTYTKGGSLWRLAKDHLLACASSSGAHNKAE
jgi:hypothetical protein